MRYFKCPSIQKNEEFKKQYAKLLIKEKEHKKKEKILGRIYWILFFVIFVLITIGGIWLIWQIPEPKSVLLCIGLSIARVISTFVFLVIGAIIAALALSPLDKKIENKAKRLSKDLLASATEYLRNYYELQSPCLVTKCYDATDKKFKNHDICLFVKDNELRLCTNLVNGFLDSDKDLGCYAFTKEELTLTERVTDKYTAAVLTCGKTEFVLGKRAKRFIERSLHHEKEA